jgi:hypothetical protein
MSSMQNSDALVTAIVAVGMGAAAVIDLRTRRIPNILTATMAAAGIGLAAAGFGRVGLGASLLGCLLGLAFMMPGHIFGRTGGGDVKLLAAAGALLGPTDTIYAFLYTAIARRRRVAPPPRSDACLDERAGVGQPAGARRGGKHRLGQPVCLCPRDRDRGRAGRTQLVTE